MNLQTYLMIKQAAYTMPGPTQYVPPVSNTRQLSIPIGEFNKMIENGKIDVDPVTAQKYNNMFEIFNTKADQRKPMRLFNTITGRSEPLHPQVQSILADLENNSNRITFGNYAGLAPGGTPPKYKPMKIKIRI